MSWRVAEWRGGSFDKRKKTGKEAAKRLTQGRRSRGEVGHFCKPD